MECNVFSGLGIRLPLVLLTARSLALSPSAILIAIVQTQAGNAANARLTLHTATLHDVSHQITRPKTASCRPGANDGTAFKRCMQIPPKGKAQFDGRLSHRQVLSAKLPITRAGS